MGRRFFHGGALLDPEADAPVPGALLVEDGRIRARLPADAAPPAGAEPVALRGRLLAPGYLDLHYHGRLIFERAEDAPRALAEAAARLLRGGVTGFLPTTVAWPRAELLARAGAWAEACAELVAGEACAQPLGLHLEGPWISADAAGAQPRGAIRPFDAEEFAALRARTEGWLRMVTLAPEAPGARALLEALARAGVRAALGHSHADAACAEAAIGAGASHITHLFNAMGALHHRAPGLAGVALSDPRVSCDVICDGVHVHPALLRVALRAKREQVTLITDRIEPPRAKAASAARGEADAEASTARDEIGADARAESGAASGEADAGARDASDAAARVGFGPVEERDGALRLSDGQLAGSALTMERAVRGAVAHGGLTLHEAVAAATLHPARVLGLEAERGTLRPGARADLLALTPDGEVEQIWLAGERV